MASFTQEEIDLIKARGNQYCSAVWLGLYDPKLTPFPDTKDEHKIRDFMITKYEKKRFYIDPSVALKIMSSTQDSASSSAASTPGSDSAGRGGAGSLAHNHTTTTTSSVSRPSVPASQSLGSVSSSGSSLSGMTSPPLNNNNNNNNNKLPGPRPSASLDLLADLGQSNPGDPFASPTGKQPPSAPLSQPSFANFENANIFTNNAMGYLGQQGIWSQGIGSQGIGSQGIGSQSIGVAQGIGSHSIGSQGDWVICIGSTGFGLTGGQVYFSPQKTRTKPLTPTPLLPPPPHPHPPSPPAPCAHPSPYLAWDDLEGEEVNAGTPLIPMAESFVSLSGTTNRTSAPAPATPVFASGVSAQFVFPANPGSGADTPHTPVTPAITNRPIGRGESPTPSPPAASPLLGSIPSSSACRKPEPYSRPHYAFLFPSLTRTCSLPGSGGALGVSHNSPDLKSGGRASPRTMALLFSSMGRRGSPQPRGSYQSLGECVGSGEDEEHLLDDLETQGDVLPHPSSPPIPIAKSLLHRHCSSPLSSSCPTRASPLTNTPTPLHLPATNTAWGLSGRGEGGGLSASASMTPTNANLAGATATSSRPTPPGPHLTFSSNPLTPLTPNSSSTPTPNAPTNAAAAAPPHPTGKTSLDRYAALKDLDDELKTIKENETFNGGVTWPVPNGAGPQHQHPPPTSTSTSSSTPNTSTSNSVFGSSTMNGAAFGSPPTGVFGGGVNGGGPGMGTPPTAPSPWQNFSGANPFSGVNNGSAWVNGGTPMATPGSTHAQQAFGTMVQPNPFGTAPDPHFNQFGGGAVLNGAGPGAGGGGSWANFPPHPQQPSKMQWTAANGTPNPFMAAGSQMPSSASYNPFL
ncbi:Arf-GAP domain and FG repeat-containing protein 2 [Chionoecetes opilio]|uniref:Arf-GAP domain and FG repeat-containing protein 2 n=1 Tax=Chionoecetes opilio TaxID=41210 RepID=A0A8J5CVC5_CHIOP|nr:Arf-GAP domain and FG repeat-containing protein 2 [Chionoecetes opilio]